MFALQVTFIEFKLKSSDLVAAVGQIITRSRHLFEHQPDRTVAYALALSLDTVKLCRMTKLAESGGIKLEASLELPLTTGNSPAMWTEIPNVEFTVANLAPGLLIIANLLSTSPADLGFRPPLLPMAVNVGADLLHSFRSLRQGRQGG